MDTPKLSAAQRHMNQLFTGTWRGEAKLFPSEHDPDGGITFGTWVVSPSVDGFALLVDYTEERAGAALYRGHGVHSWDARDQCFYAFWFDNLGVVQHGGHRATLEVTTGRYSYGNDRTRFTYQFAGDELTFLIETARAGSEWARAHEGRYLRESSVEVGA